MAKCGPFWQVSEKVGTKIFSSTYKPANRSGAPWISRNIFWWEGKRIYLFITQTKNQAFQGEITKKSTNSEDESVPKYLKNFLWIAVAQSVVRQTWNLAIRVRSPRGPKPFSCLGRHLGYLKKSGTKIFSLTYKPANISPLAIKKFLGTHIWYVILSSIGFYNDYC